MKEKKKIGVWLDHTKAHLIRFQNGQTFLLESVESPYRPRERFEGEESDVTQFRGGGVAVSNNENRKHHRVQHQLEAFFTEIEGKLKEYDEILLFGPSIAKNQLQHHLAPKKAFANKTIAISNADKLRRNKMLEFVRKYFNSVN